MPPHVWVSAVVQTGHTCNGCVVRVHLTFQVPPGYWLKRWVCLFYFNGDLAALDNGYINLNGTYNVASLVVVSCIVFVLHSSSRSIVSRERGPMGGTLQSGALGTADGQMCLAL